MIPKASSVTGEDVLRTRDYVVILASRDGKAHQVPRSIKMSDRGSNVPEYLGVTSQAPSRKSIDEVAEGFLGGTLI